MRLFESFSNIVHYCSFRRSRLTINPVFGISWQYTTESDVKRPKQKEAAAALQKMSPTQDDGMAELPKLAFSIKMLRQLQQSRSLAQIIIQCSVQIRPLETLKFMSVDFEMELINWGIYLSQISQIMLPAAAVLSFFIMPHYACYFPYHTVFWRVSGVFNENNSSFCFQAFEYRSHTQNHLLIANSNRCILCCANNSVHYVSTTRQLTHCLKIAQKYLISNLPQTNLGSRCSSLRSQCL